MAIKVYQSKLGIPNIGINVSGANTAPNSLQSISNSFAQTSNLFFQAAGDEAKKVGQEFGYSVPIEKVIGINPETGTPEAYSMPEGYGTIAMDAFKAVIDQRFFESIEADYKAKAKELYARNQLDVKGFEDSFLKYTSSVVDNAKGKFKEFARELGINQLKGYSAHIKSNLFQESVRKADALNEKQDAEYLVQAFQAGKGTATEPVINQLGIPYLSEDSQTVPVGYMNGLNEGFELSKQALIASGRTTKQNVLNTIRQGNFVYLTGILDDVLDLPSLKEDKVLSDAFASSIQRLEVNGTLPKEAQDYIRLLVDIGPDQKMLDTINKMYKSDRSLKQAFREEAAKDAKDKADRDAKNLKKENKLSSIQNEQSLIDEIEKIAEDIKQSLLNGENIDFGGKIFDYFDNAEKTNINNVEANALDPAKGYPSKAEVNSVIEENKKQVVNQIISSSIRAVSKEMINENTTPEQIQNIKNVFSQVISGSITSKDISDEIVGSKAGGYLRQLLDNVNNPESFIIDFNESREFSVLNTQKEKLIKLRSDTQAAQKAQEELNQKTLLGKDRFRLLTDIPSLLTNITGAIKNNLPYDNLVTGLMDRVKNSTNLQSRYGDKPLLTSKEAAAEISKIQQSVAKHLIAEDLLDFIVEENGVSIDLQIKHFEALQDFLDSGSSRIPIPQNFKDEYNKIRNQYDIDATTMKGFFKDILNNYTGRISELKAERKIAKNYVNAQNGTEGMSNLDNWDSIWQVAEFGADRNGYNKFDYFLGPQILGNETQYKAISNGNVSEDLFDIVKLFSNDPTNPVFERDTGYFLEFLRNIRHFPTGVGDNRIDITPTKFTNDADIMRLLTVLDFVDDDANIEQSSMKTLLINAREGSDKVRAFKDKYKNDFDNDSYSGHIDKRFSKKGINRFTDPDFFKMIDNETDVAIAIGVFNDVNGLDNYLEKRYEERYLVSNKIIENVSNTSGINRTRFATERQLVDKKLRVAAEDESVTSIVMPFFLDIGTNTSDEGLKKYVEQGFALQFGDKLYPSKNDYNKQNVIQIFYSPNRTFNAVPITTQNQLDDGTLYSQPALKNPNAEVMGVYFKMPGMPNMLPLGGLRDTTTLDLLSKHHYTTIAKGESLVEYSNQTTVNATTIGFRSDNGTVLHYLIPTFWDGKIMPTETEADLTALINRIEQSGIKHTEYPSFLSPEEAKIWYDGIKDSWQDIGTNDEQAQSILDIASFQTEDILQVNLLEIARGINLIEQIKLNDKRKAKELRKNKQILSDYYYGGMPQKFRKSITGDTEEVDLALDEMIIEDVNKRNERRRNTYENMRNSYQRSNFDLPKHFEKLYSIHPMENNLGLPGIDQLGNRDNGRLSDDMLNFIFNLQK